MATAQILDAFPEPILRLTVEQYRQMSEAGILAEDTPVELLEGLLVEKMGKNPPHVFSVGKTFRLLLRLLPEGWYVNSEQPVDTDDSEPEPDFSIIRGKLEDFATRVPSSSDVGLVIEVANTTLKRDREVKVRIYGRAGIPAYWIINLEERTVEVHTEPYADELTAGYRKRAVFDVHATLPLVLDGVEVAQIPTADVLP